MFFSGLGQGIPYLLFLPGVTLAALYGGLAAGLLATIVSAALAFFWIQRGFMSPVESLAMAVFFITCTMISFVCEVLLRAQARAKLAQEKIEAANQELRREMAERERSERELRRIEWLLTRKHRPEGERDGNYVPPYGDLVPLNTCRVIRDAVGEAMLTDIVSDYLDLLETSAAVYEKNGDYALGIFSSGWCRFMDAAAWRICGTADNREVLLRSNWWCCMA